MLHAQNSKQLQNSYCQLDLKYLQDLRTKRINAQARIKSLQKM